MLGKLHIRVLAAAVVMAGLSTHASGAAVPPPAAPATGPLTSASTPAPPGPTTTTTTATTPPPPPAPEPTTTTTTAPAPPAPEPTVTTTPTTAPPPPPEPAPREVAAAEPSRQERIEAIADGSGWDWRAAGIRLTVGYYPGDCCHWGVYESAAKTLWIGPSAFADPDRLRYVVLHELAHGWQYTRDRFPKLLADYQPFGMSTYATALEAGGDCIAALWGATDRHYWTCPAAALATAARRLAGDWT